MRAICRNVGWRLPSINWNTVKGEALGCVKAIFNPVDYAQRYLRGKALEFLREAEIRYLSRAAGFALKADWLVDVASCVAGASHAR